MIVFVHVEAMIVTIVFVHVTIVFVHVEAMSTRHAFAFAKPVVTNPSAHPIRLGGGC